MPKAAATMKEVKSDQCVTMSHLDWVARSIEPYIKKVLWWHIKANAIIPTAGTIPAKLPNLQLSEWGGLYAGKLEVCKS